MDAPRALASAALAVLSAVGVCVVPAPTASATTAVSPAMAPDTYESRIEYWINRKRGRHGLPAVRLARCADLVAERWARYLADNDAFYHQSMTDVLNRCDASWAGETLGRGAVSPRRLVRAWMHSPEHRAILLSRKARRIGVGAAPDAFGRWVVAADFMRF